MSKKLFSIFFIISFLYLLSFPVKAVAQLADTPWPKFHHDLRNTGKTANFGTQVGRLKWKFVTGGAVTSSPAIDDNGIIYVGSADNNLYAINAETGALEWKYTTGGPINRSSPAIDVNGIIYVGSYDGSLYAFDTNTIDPLDPNPKWSYKTGGAIASSPSINVNGNIIFTSADGNIYAISSGGSLQWKTEIGSSWCSPAIDTTKSQVYVGSWIPQGSKFNTVDIEIDNQTITMAIPVNFFALNSSTGTIKWEFPYFCTPGGILSSPVVASDHAVIASFFMTWSADCGDDQSEFHIWNLADDGASNWGLQIGGKNDIYTTPAMLEDNSFFIGSGSDLYRIVPDGQVYFSSPVDGERIESSPAIDGGKLIFVGSNGGRFYCLCADCPETPILWQYPPAGEDPLLATNVGGTVSKASIISSPAIGDDERHSVYVGASDGCVYAFYDGPRISGKVELVDSDNDIKTPFRAVKITLSSEFMDEDRVTYTDTNGNYEFAGVENYTYTITPEKIGYVFGPESATAVIKQEQDASNVDFEAFSGFTISGSIKNPSGNSVAGVDLTIDGEKSVQSATTTDSSGFYTFTGLSFDTYTITPSLSGYGFTPPFKEITIASSDATRDKNNIDFTATLGYQISGKVIDITSSEETEKGIPGINMRLTGETSDLDTTDENGAFSFVGLGNGEYTVEPSRTGYTFDPISKEVTIASGNVYNVNFNSGTGSTVSGYIQLEKTDNSTILSVTVNLFTMTGKTIDLKKPQTVNPDKDGYFVFIGVGDGTYVIKPTLEGYGFDPLSRTVTVKDSGDSGISNQNFVAQEGYYISGKVTNFLDVGFANIPVDLEGDSTGTAETNDDGVYSFTGLDPGDYTVKIDQVGFTTWQGPKDVELIGESKEDINFILNTVCPVVFVNIPFIGSRGSIVNIFGTSFGWEEPDEEGVTYTIGDSGVSLEGGVYFGKEDPETWVKADAKSWTNFRIVAEMPYTPPGFGIYSVWVVNEIACGYTTAMSTNLFILLP